MVSNLQMQETYRTERDFVQGLVWSMFMADYGIITSVNSDDTVDVKHAIKLVLNTDEALSETVTPNIEVLWPASNAFSMRHTLAVGDRVLLIGLKFRIDSVDIDNADYPKDLFHYSQETLKAIPLCLYNADAGTTIEEHEGDLLIDSGNIELNGNTKSFVTHAELNTALQGLVTTLNTQMGVIAGGATAAIAASGLWWTPLATFIGGLSLDISSSETTTILTGG